MSTYIVWFQFGSTLEIVSLEYSLLQESAVRFRIRFLMLLHFICWHANKESTKFIKDINKDGCSGIFNSGSQDISPSRLWIELVALFTSPAIITFLRKLLFTVGAAWIGCILLSDECKGCTYAEIVNLNIYTWSITAQHRCMISSLLTASPWPNLSLTSATVIRWDGFTAPASPRWKEPNETSDPWESNLV